MEPYLLRGSVGHFQAELATLRLITTRQEDVNQADSGEAFSLRQQAALGQDAPWRGRLPARVRLHVDDKAMLAAAGPKDAVGKPFGRLQFATERLELLTFYPGNLRQLACRCPCDDLEPRS
jgi:hypothetical protein